LLQRNDDAQTSVITMNVLLAYAAE